jgi:type IV secretory pathway VirB2 component (pilin)
MRKLSSLFRPRLAHRERIVHVAFVLAFLLFLPLPAHASPFDGGISNVSTLFTGTAAKAGSLIAVVLGGLGFAFGDPGAKKALAGVAFGVGIALMAGNVISWLWSA